MGANRGQFALSVVELGHRAYSFEPSLSTCAILKANIKKARRIWQRSKMAAGSVEVHCAAVGAIAGNVTFAQPRGAKSVSFHITRGDTPQFAGNQTHRVPIVRLDDIIHEPRGSYLFLKTDTEGFEAQVTQVGSNSRACTHM